MHEKRDLKRFNRKQKETSQEITPSVSFRIEELFRRIESRKDTFRNRDGDSSRNFFEESFNNSLRNSPNEYSAIAIHYWIHSEIFFNRISSKIEPVICQ